MKRQSNEPIKGLATLEKSKPSGSKIKVTFQPTKKDPTTRTYVVLATDAPAYVRDGLYLVKMNSTGEKIYSTSPVEGMFQVRIDKYFAKENQPPVWTTYTGMGNNGVYDYLAFSVGLVITKGKEKDMPITAFLRYHFEADRDNPKLVVFSHPKSKFTDTLEDYITVSGVMPYLDSGKIPYSDNILPSLEKVQQRYGKEFVVLMKAGFIDKFLPLMVVDEDATAEALFDDGIPTDVPVPTDVTVPDQEVLTDNPPFEE